MIRIQQSTKTFQMLLGFVGLMTFMLLAGGAAEARTAKIPLRYKAVGVKAPAGCPGKITVVTFEDKRLSPNLGEAPDGTTLSPESSVARWVSRALADELEAAACKVESQDAVPTQTTDILVTGKVLEVSIVKKSLVDYNVIVTLSVSIQKGSAPAQGKEYKGSLSRTAWPTPKKAIVYLEEGLQITLKEVVADIMKTAR